MFTKNTKGNKNINKKTLYLNDYNTIQSHKYIICIYKHDNCKRQHPYPPPKY